MAVPAGNEGIYSPPLPLEGQMEEQASVLDPGAKAAWDEASPLRAQEVQLPRDGPGTAGQLAFRTLPTEIRCLIWDHALPQDVVTLTLRETDGFFAAEEGERGPPLVSWSVTPIRQPPAITQACREARAVAYRTGKIVSIKGSEQFREQWTWFDPRSDRVTVDIQSLSFSQSFHLVPAIVHHAECLVLEASAPSGGLHFRNMFSPRLFPNLKRVHCMIRSDSLTLDSTGGVPFDLNSPITVDLDKIEDLLPPGQVIPGRDVLEQHLDRLKKEPLFLPILGDQPAIQAVLWDQYSSAAAM